MLNSFFNFPTMFSLLVTYFHSPDTIVPCSFSLLFTFFLSYFACNSLFSPLSARFFSFHQSHAFYFSLPQPSSLSPPSIALCHSIFNDPSCSTSSSSGFFLIYTSPLRIHLHNCPLRVQTMILARNQTCFPVFKTHRTEQGNAIMSIPLYLEFMTAALCTVGANYL